MKKLLLLFLSFVTCSLIQAQWISDPDVNTLLSTGDTTYSYGEFRVNPQDSSYYNLYYNHVDDPTVNFVIYLQKFDFNGVKQWQDKGILVSNAANRTWVPGLNMAFNQDSCIYVAYSKVIPQQGTEDTLVHMCMNKITQNGEKLWGDEGIDISEPDAFGDYEPELLVSNANNIVISYSNSILDDFLGMEVSKVKIKQYSPDGSLLWWHDMPLNQGQMDWGSRLVQMDNNIMILYKHDTIYEDPDTAAYRFYQSIHSWQFDENGNPVFDQPKNVFNYPYLLGEVPLAPIKYQKDKNGGLYFSTGYESYLVFHTFVQYLDENSDTLFPHAMKVSTNDFPSTDRGDYDLGYFEESDELAVIWIEKVYETGNEKVSILGQKFNKDGQRLWDENGMVLHSFVSMNDKKYSWSVVKNSSDNNVVFLYMEYLMQNEIVNVRAEKLNSEGAMVWPKQTLLSSRPDVKAFLFVTNEIDEQFVATWDLDLGAGYNNILYGQNIKTDGQIGTGINDMINPISKLSIYPNPMDNVGVFKIRLKTQNPTSLKIRMINIHGQEIISHETGRLPVGENEVEVPLNGIHEGLYVIYFVANNNISSCKIIVY